MRKYCIYCGKPLKKDQNEKDVCLSCKKDNFPDVKTEEELHNIHQSAHLSIRNYNDKRNNSLCYVIIGLILLVIGAVFLVLSFKYNVIKERVFTPLSLEFFVCVACLGTGVFCEINGFIRFFNALNHMNYYKKYIIDTQRTYEKK